MDSLPLHTCHIHKTFAIVNKLYALIHSVAIASVIYLRASSPFMNNKTTPNIPLLLVFASELVLSFMWLKGVSYRWRPVSRTTFPERLPENEKLPGIEVFICTADPKKEPTVEVMNTVISAMAMDYPPEKLHVYVSDDAGSCITLHGAREAWLFARSWLPFCRKYGIVKTRCLSAFFSALDDGCGDDEFMVERRNIKKKYEEFKERVLRTTHDGDEHTSNPTAKDHPTHIENVAIFII
ncbi:Cellulose synthase [Dillenia turbinata]|uniref:Cellulose synthase n=1 Tax=Dillenia turbinata TaxID=194707 RepID=A0AAN8UMP1_9MAGN